MLSVKFAKSSLLILLIFELVVHLGCLIFSFFAVVSGDLIVAFLPSSFILIAVGLTIFLMSISNCPDVTKAHYICWFVCSPLSYVFLILLIPIYILLSEIFSRGDSGMLKMILYIIGVYACHFVLFKIPTYILAAYLYRNDLQKPEVKSNQSGKSMVSEKSKKSGKSEKSVTGQSVKNDKKKLKPGQDSSTITQLNEKKSNLGSKGSKLKPKPSVHK